MGQFIAFLAQGASVGTAATAASAVAAGTMVPLSAAASYGLTAMPALTGAGAAAGGFLGLSSATWSGLSTAGSMLSGIASGNQQAAAYKMQAQQEEFAAKDREVSRRQRLVANLASQNAYRGASGVRAFEGSPAAMMKSDWQSFDYDQSMGAANLAMSTSSLLESGKYAQQSGYMSAGTSLLEYGSRRAKRG